MVGITIASVGGVVTPGQKLMDIVPDSEGVVLGDDVARFLNGISLQRAEDLMNGQKPATASEKDLLARLQSQLPALP